MNDKTDKNNETDKKIIDFIYWVITGFVVIVITYISGPKEEFKMILYGILLLVVLFIFWAKGAKQRRKEMAKIAEQRQEIVISEIRDGFSGLSKRVDVLQEVQASTMRTQLIHYAEKYLERGWFTPEEHQSWYNMYEMYLSIVGKNGFIETYKEKLDRLPERELDAVIEDYRQTKK